MKPYFYDDDFMWNVLGIRELPTTLFQYTSLDSLEKILENQSIRFSRLDTVNDPEEATAADVQAAATSVFVSCWSASETESIPMWSMYGDRFQGVRLALPSNMFLARQKPMVFAKGGAQLIVGYDSTPLWVVDRETPAMQKFGRGLTGPNKIHYSNDPIFRTPTIFHREAGRVNCYTYDLGMAKTPHWSYEDEWRYKISYFPDETNWPDDSFFRNVTADFKTYPVLTEQIFVPLDPSAFDGLSITKGPLMSEADGARLSDIVSKFAPSSKISDSGIPMRAQPGK
jgi:hypothetical protein